VELLNSLHVTRAMAIIKSWDTACWLLKVI